MSANEVREANAKRVWLTQYAQPAVDSGKMSDQEFATAINHEDVDGALERLQQIRVEHEKGGGSTYKGSESRAARMCAFRARTLIGRYRDLCEDLVNPVRNELMQLRAGFSGSVCAG